MMDPITKLDSLNDIDLHPDSKVFDYAERSIKHKVVENSTEGLAFCKVFEEHALEANDFTAYKAGWCAAMDYVHTMLKAEA